MIAICVCDTEWTPTAYHANPAAMVEKGGSQTQEHKTDLHILHGQVSETSHLGC